MDPSPARLPYDIFVSIIEELASQGCYKSLRACSHTCRMFLHPCRVHLFSTMKIDKNAHQFAALLNGNSTIPNYIRYLTYQPSVLTADIANALLLLNKIQTFALCDFNSPQGWDSLTPPIRHALIHLFSSPSITRISIYQSSYFPAALLSNCSNLTHLILRRQVSFTSQMCDTSDTIPDAQARPKLLSLDISGATIPAVGEWHPFGQTRADGPPQLDLSHLQSLSFRMGGVRKIFLEDVLGACLKLERLSVSAIQDAIPDDMLQTIRIVLPTLRSLKLEWWLHADLISFEFPRVIKALQGLAHHPNGITQLQLFMWIPGSHTWADQDWGRIDHILVDRSNFRELEKLDVKLWVHQGASGYEDLRKRMTHFKTTKFPLLCLAADDYLDFNISYL